MARAKASERKAKSNIADELINGVAKLRELSSQIEDLSRDGFPYREASRARTELSLRETIRRLFGEKSPEYHAHKHHKLRVGSRAESAQSITLIKQLVLALESQKADLLGLKSPVASQPTGAVLERPALTSVPLNSPPHPPMEQSAPSAAPLAEVNMTNPPITVSATRTLTTPVESISNVIAAPSLPMDALAAPPPSAPSSGPISIAAPCQQPDSPLSNSTEAAKTVSVSACDSEARSVPCQSTQAVSSCPVEEISPLKPHSHTKAMVATVASELTAISQPPPPAHLEGHGPSARTEAVQSESLPPSSGSSSSIASMAVHAKNDQADAPNRPLSTQTSKPFPLDSSDIPSERAGARQTGTEIAPTESGTLDLLRRVCMRFHLVARQLRLRKEYRPTLEITDEYDLQDLFYALLRLQFDEVGTEEWTPDYTNGARRTSYLLDWDRIVVVVKQTRTGLATKDLAEQVKADAAHYAARPDGTTLLCFIYDPDGRVGNPRGLEADLTTVSDSYMVEVIVAPK